MTRKNTPLKKSTWKNRVLAPACILISVAGMLPPLSAAQANGAAALYYLDLTPEERSRDQIAWKQFFALEQRERCQHYWAPPDGFMMVGCDIHRIYMPPTADTRTREIMQKTVDTPAPAKARPVLQTVSSYTLYFDFGKARIRPDQAPVLTRAAKEIVKYSPDQVTVSGYTDTAGPATYNMTLSRNRAQAVSTALTAKGVKNVIIDKASYGEDNLAVQTANGTPNRDNRRVVVEFRRQALP